MAKEVSGSRTSSLSARPPPAAPPASGSSARPDLKLVSIYELGSIQVPQTLITQEELLDMRQDTAKDFKC
ncbi:hypothetical protein Bca4012_018661 [Brassica carinata]|uniref:Uncharacterized protein n=1 Tax=Brassica carinata TaxID=52824 RepID=A0A8X7WK94_BRACI|nr:hypothetical protein Bca52824_002966 [Brassica carinata]